MKRLRGLLVLLATGVLLLAAAFVSLRAAGHFESSLSREQSAVEREIGRTIIEVIEKAVDSGIPFDRLAGVESYLETVKRENKGVAYLVVSDMTGRIRYGTSLAGIRQRPQFERSIADWSRFEFFGRIGGYFNTAVPVNYEGRQIAWLHVGSRANIVEQLLQEIAFDIVTVLIVSVLVAFELLRLLLTVSFSMPLRALQNFLSGISSGDFQRYLPRDFIGGIGRVNSHINAIVGELNRRADHLRQAGKKLPEGFSFHAPRERKTLAVSDVDIIRWPFFLMIFADALSLSFFPVYVSQFYDPSFPLPRQVEIGKPTTTCRGRGNDGS